jgi:hypothetical protein
VEFEIKVFMHEGEVEQVEVDCLKAKLEHTRQRTVSDKNNTHLGLPAFFLDDHPNLTSSLNKHHDSAVRA